VGLFLFPANNHKLANKHVGEVFCHYIFILTDFISYVYVLFLAGGLARFFMIKKLVAVGDSGTLEA